MAHKEGCGVMCGITGFGHLAAPITPSEAFIFPVRRCVQQTSSDFQCLLIDSHPQRAGVLMFKAPHSVLWWEKQVRMSEGEEDGPERLSAQRILDSAVGSARDYHHREKP